MTLRPAWLADQGAQRLVAAGYPSGPAEARILLADALHIQTTDLAVTSQVDPASAARFEKLIQARLAGTPLQYLTGVAHFRYSSLLVGPGVLIPRPETEGLVQLVIDWIANLGLARPVVVDLGTGSGAIALALASETPAAVYAVEASVEAWEYAKANLAGRGVVLELGDWAQAFGQLDGQADVVVANPPYIPDGTSLPVDVCHEPAEALFAGDDGLDAIAEVVAAAERLLRPGGLLAVEHDEGQAVSAPALARASGAFIEVVDLVDLVGRPRYLTARRRVDRG